MRKSMKDIGTCRKDEKGYDKIRIFHKNGFVDEI
jgi:hypothetical protein